MAEFSRKWWGQAFIDGLETFSDTSRLARGRTYARGNKVKSFKIEQGSVIAQVRGSINPYFGVHKEPLYTTTLDFEPISRAKWSAITAVMASKASMICRLLLNEIPENIEENFKILGVSFLPQSTKDFKGSCTCPDWSNPCKHIAGVYYLLAQEIDQDPFLLFELRGLSRQDLQAELAKSPLGQALSAEMGLTPPVPEPVECYYTRPILQTMPPSVPLKDFWQGQSLPNVTDTGEPGAVSGVLIKKQGDFPAFWPRDNSFITVMEEIYERVRSKNKKDVL